MKTCRYRIYLLSLVSIVALFRLGFTPAPSVTLCVPPPSRREAFTANVVTLVLLYCKHFAFALLARSRALCLRLRSLPPPHTFRLLPLPRYACHLPPGGRLLWAEKQRIICFSRGVVQRNKAHVTRLISVLCHAVFGLGGGYTMRLSITRNAYVYYAAKSAVKTGVCDFGHKSAHAQHAAKSGSVRRYNE